MIVKSSIEDGQVWQINTQKSPVVVLGNCWVGKNNDYIWVANRRTGKKQYIKLEQFAQILKTKDYPSTLKLCRAWAKKGHSHVMDWLGWFYEDNVNGEASTWFYVAALRRNREAYIENADRVFIDALQSEIAKFNTSEGGKVRFPTQSYLRNVPEIVAFWNDYGLFYHSDQGPIRIGNDWLSALNKAEEFLSKVKNNEKQNSFI